MEKISLADRVRLRNENMLQRVQENRNIWDTVQQTKTQMSRTHLET